MTLTRKRLLQTLIVMFSLLPIGAGLGGMLLGSAAFYASPVTASFDSHTRYLSGLLFGIALCFLSCVAGLEHKSERIGFLSLIVVCGGLARLLGWIVAGNPGPYMLLGLGMELIVVPLIWWGVRGIRKAGV